MSWDPGQYNRFADERSTPLEELLAHVPDQAGGEVLDLGCGSGVAIPLIRDRWPGARITAIDNSAEMLEAAGQNSDARTMLIQADIASWTPVGAFDLVFSNAALHWLDDHDTLFPRLMDWLAPGGVLAVQMPNNWAEPSHRLMAETAKSGPWRQKLAPLLREAPVGDIAFYEKLLKPVSQTCDIWETVFAHALQGEDAVYHWIEGTSLKPLLDALEGDERLEFSARYKDALAAAYPRDEDGVTDFPFHRLFIVATACD